MRRITWRGGPGYGDFMNGLCYSHNCTLKYSEMVEITFYWPHEEDYLFSSKDSETVIDRLHSVHERLRVAPVTIKHEFYPDLNEFRNKPRFINAPDVNHALHGFWYPIDEIKSNNKIVALWTDEENVSALNPIKAVHGSWDALRHHLKESGYTVKELTYRTPSKIALDILEECEFGIGYHGMFHQVFNYLWKPLIIISSNPERTRSFQTSAKVVKNINNVLDTDLEILVLQSLYNTENNKELFRKYLSKG